MRKFFVFFTFLLFSFVLFASPAKAQEITTRDDMNLDEGLSDQDLNAYGYIDSIAVVTIHGDQSSGFSDGEQWMKGLYYYMITHLGFVDVPFNYVVTWQGDIFEGKGGGYEVRPISNFALGKDYNNPLVIAYFDNGRGLTNQGEDAINEIVSRSVLSFSVETGDVVAGDFSIKTSEGAPSTIDVVPTNEGSIFDWVENFKVTYVPGDDLGLELSGDVEEMTYTESATSWGDTSVRLVVKNTGDYPWYNSGTRATYLATSSPRSHNSDFYNPTVWSSFSRAVTPKEEIVMPGESATFEFVSRAPILPGNYTEKFELLRLPSSWVDGTQVSMTVGVSKGNLQLVEIKETGTGFLTVRECGHPNCKQISAVETGYVTILREEKVGWSKIVYDGVNEGWVFGQYVKKL